jgi:predicted amidohydrolase
MTKADGNGATFRVGLIQMRSGRAPRANIDAAVLLIGEAKAAGADYVQTPEMTNIMEVKRENLFDANPSLFSFPIIQPSIAKCDEKESS